MYSTLPVLKLETFTSQRSSASKNIDPISLTLEVSKLDKSSSVNYLQCANINAIFVTLDVFQPDKFRFINVDALLNIPYIFVTLDTSQSDKSSVMRLSHFDDTSLNRFDISVIFTVFIFVRSGKHVSSSPNLFS